MLCGAKPPFLFFSLFFLICYPDVTIGEKKEEREVKSEENQKETTTFCRKSSFLFGADDGT